MVWKQVARGNIQQISYILQTESICVASSVCGM